MAVPSVAVSPRFRVGPGARLRVGHTALIELSALALLTAVAFRLRVANLEHYSGSFDEGVRMQQLLLIEHGYRPYRDIFASQGPLLLDLLYPFYTAFGQSVGAARLGVIVLSLAGLLGAWWAGRAVSPLAGLGAALLLALSPSYLENSRLALAEVPSLAPCLWAIGCGLRWRRGGSGLWLYGAMILLTIGVLIKPMALPAIAPLAVLVLSKPPRRFGPVIGAVLVSLGLTLVLLLLLGPARVFEVLGSYRLGAQRTILSSVEQNWSLISRVLMGERLGFATLVVSGTLLGLLHWRSTTIALAAWPLAQLSLFMVYTDLSDKHVVYLVPSLALLGGLVLAALGVTLSRLLADRTAADGAAGRHPTKIRERGWTSAVAAIGLAAVAVYMASMPTLWHADRLLRWDADERARRDYEGTQEQAALMAALTTPAEFVLTDNPYAAFQARRLVPPWLADTSGTRIDAGSLTADVAIREARAYQPGVIVTWRRRLGKLDDFNRWLSDNYRFLKTYPGSDPSAPLQLYVRPDLEEQGRAFLATVR